MIGMVARDYYDLMLTRPKMFHNSDLALYK